MARRYWLMKCEPSAYTIEDLERDGRTSWEGVRNYQARNFMRDDMRVGDRVLVHHSSTDEPGIAGTATVAREGYPDPLSWDPDSEYFDPKSSPEAPRWVMVDVAFESRFPRVLTFADLRAVPALKDMLLLKRGQRLSIMPCTPREFEAVLKLAAKRR